MTDENRFVEHNDQILLVGADGVNPVGAHNPDPRAVIGHDDDHRTTDPYIPGVDHSDDDVMDAEEAADADVDDKGETENPLSDENNPAHVAEDTGAGAPSAASEDRGETFDDDSEAAKAGE